MFATKKAANDWIKDFAKGRKLESRRFFQFWAIYDMADGLRLVDEQIAEIEDAN